MKLLDSYLDLQYQIFSYFGYVEDWRVLPLEDSRKYYWRLYGEGPGSVRFADSKAELDDEDMDYYEDEIYMQRHLERWVYRGDEFTMVCVDTHIEGNQLLRVFDNSKEVPDE